MRKRDGYWTLERCKKEALKYKTRSDWRWSKGGSYSAAQRNGWLYICSKYMIRNRKPNGYWTLERCKKEALKYKTKKEWINKSSSSYCKADKCGWMSSSSSHMRKYKPCGYWTLERCKKEALKYKTKREWRNKSSSSYSIVGRKKWINLCCKHMISTKKPDGYWTLERCKKEAKRFKFRTEWFNKSSYSAAQRNGWLYICSKHFKTIGSQHKRMIYVVIFSDKHCYVGLTYNFEERKNDHLGKSKRKKQKKSPVLTHLKKTGLIPKFIELTDYMSREKAQRKEKFFLKKYKSLGYVALNKAQTGSLGGNVKKWTKENCLRTAKLCKTRGEWVIKFPAAYSNAKKFGWFDLCVKHMPIPVRYTKKDCLLDAKKYKTRSEWHRKSSGVCSSARRKGWYAESVKHMILTRKPEGYWTKERSIASAKKYKTKSEWQRNDSSAYHAAHNHNWFNECVKHMIPTPRPKKWTFKVLKADALKYKTKMEWRLKSPGARSAARKLKIYDIVTKHMKDGRIIS